MFDPKPVSITIKVPGLGELAGTYPIILIGPNGSGKTRFGAQIASENGVGLINALRNIAISDSIPMRTSTEAKNQLHGKFSDTARTPWALSNEIDDLFAKLYADHASKAMSHFQAAFTSQPTTPQQTKFLLLKDLWARLFPGRSLNLEDYTPRVRNDIAKRSTEYPARQMSDGERVALFLLARVLDTEQKLIIVDEPEVHFHSKLSILFWDELEKLRTDCRFLYITHDIQFALSRKNAKYIALRPPDGVQSLEVSESLPRETVASLLAAATLSIHAKRIVFCEGTDQQSVDKKFYRAWFLEPGTVVVPVGSCRNVIRCASTFSDQKLVSNVQALGIVDRDYWPNQFLESLHKSVHVLPFHEIESLLCVQAVFTAVAVSSGLPETSCGQLYNQFLAKAALHFNEHLASFEISMRFRKRSETILFSILNNLKPGETVEETMKTHVASISPPTWKTEPEQAFLEEQDMVLSALKAPYQGLLKVLPGKPILKIAAEQLGVSAHHYIDHVTKLLTPGTGSKPSSSAEAMIKYFTNVLPPRTL